MSGEVKGNRKTLLSRLQVVSVELVRFFDSTEASILSNGPRFVRIHGCVGTSNKKQTPISQYSYSQKLRELNRLTFCPSEQNHYDFTLCTFC